MSEPERVEDLLEMMRRDGCNEEPERSYGWYAERIEAALERERVGQRAVSGALNILVEQCSCGKCPTGHMVFDEELHGFFGDEWMSRLGCSDLKPGERRSVVLNRAVDVAAISEQIGYLEQWLKSGPRIGPDIHMMLKAHAAALRKAMGE